MIGGYFGLLNYSYIKENHLSEDEILHKIEWFKSHANNKVYDMIDYEWLICMEIKFAEHKNIVTAIKELKQMIAKNYLLKQKMKARMLLRDK